MTEPLECVDGVCLPRNSAEVEEENLEQSENNEAKDEVPKKEDKKKNHKKKTSGSSNPNIQKIHSQRDLDSFLSSNDAVIVEFMTTWCGACKGIEPLLEELAEENVESVAVAQVVCDKNKETKKLADAHGIKSYPVFVMFVNGTTSQKWNGADRGKLEKAFEKLGGGGGKKKGGKKKGKR